VTDLSARHPSTQEKCRWLEPNPRLPEGSPATVAFMFAEFGNRLLEVARGGPQFTIALQHLIDAKDAAVRQVLADAD
jgi:hypothetical protein